MKIRYIKPNTKFEHTVQVTRALLHLIHTPLNSLISEKLTGGAIFEVGLTAANIGRKIFAEKEMAVAVCTCDDSDQVELYRAFGEFLMEEEKWYHAMLCFRRCLELIELERQIDISMGDKEWLEIKKLKNKAERGASESNTNNGDLEAEIVDYKNFQSAIGNTGSDYALDKRPYLFDNVSSFSIRIKLIKCLFDNLTQEELEDQKFALKIVGTWELYNLTISAVLSCIVTKGTLDFEKALNSITNFVLKLPPFLLLENIISYEVIHEILENAMRTYPDPIFKGLTVMELIDKADFFQKEKTYFKYLATYCKTAVISAIQKFFLTGIELRGFVLFEIEKVLNLLSQINLLVIFDSSNTSLPKKYADKNSKILVLYEKERAELEDLVVNLSSILCLIYCQTYKQFGFENIIFSEEVEYIRRSNIESCRSLIARCKSLCLQTISNDKTLPFRVFKNTSVYMQEVILLQNLLEVKSSSGDNISNVGSRYHIVRDDLIEELINIQFEILCENEIDNPINIKIVQRLMYYVMLNGGYHISVIWFLKGIKDFMTLNSGVSLISFEDGEDSLFDMFGNSLSYFQDVFDEAIQKVIDSQLGLEFEAFDKLIGNLCPDMMLVPSYLEGETLDFSLIAKNGRTMLLPPVVMKNYETALFFPQWVYFQKDETNNIARCKLIEENGILIEEEEKNGELKGVLKMCGEQVREALRKSKLLLELFFQQDEAGRAKIAILREPMVLKTLSIYVDHRDVIASVVDDMKTLELSKTQRRSIGKTGNKNEEILEKEWRVAREVATVFRSENSEIGDEIEEVEEEAKDQKSEKSEKDEKGEIARREMWEARCGWSRSFSSLNLDNFSGGRVSGEFAVID